VGAGDEGAAAGGGSRIGFVWNAAAGNGAAAGGTALTTRPGRGLSTAGACASTGAFCTACGFSATTFAWTGRRPVKIAPDTAVTPPGADQFV
jgi:hypothetical protein